MTDKFNVRPLEIINDVPENKDLKTLNTVSHSLQNLAIVTDEEIRENYENAQKSFKSVMKVCDDLIEEAKEVYFSDPSKVIILEKIAMLMRARNEAAKSLGELHNNMTSLIETPKELTVNNNEFHMSNEDTANLIRGIREDLGLKTVLDKHAK
jgi:hypothetical protein